MLEASYETSSRPLFAMQPMVSIIVPVYNQSKARIERCVQSIICQTFEDFEAVLVDDGSTGRCLGYMRDACSGDARFKIVSQPNSGAGAARNYGVQHSSGKYVLFLDSDDMLSDFALEDAVSALEASDADMAVGQVHKEREREWSSRLIERKAEKPIVLESKGDFDEYINHILGYQSNRFSYPDRYFCDGPVAKLCKREPLLVAPFDSERCWSEDTIWNLKMTGACKRIAISQNVWYYALANGESQTHIFRPDCEREFRLRINQEKELITELWPGCFNGLYAQVWTSTHYLFACYLAHAENEDGLKAKMAVFLRCIQEPVYREMLQGISFANEKKRSRRAVKRMVRGLCLYGPYILAYCGWEMTIKAKKGER